MHSVITKKLAKIKQMVKCIGASPEVDNIKWSPKSAFPNSSYEHDTTPTHIIIDQLREYDIRVTKLILLLHVRYKQGKVSGKVFKAICERMGHPVPKELQK